MTDVGSAIVGPTVYTEGGETFQVQLKGDCGTVEVDTRYLSEEVYKAIFLAGLEAIINKQGMSKLLPGITKLEGEEKAQRTREVRVAAEKTVQALYAGSVGGRTKAKKASSKVETEALRLAKNMAKDIIRANGQKQNAYSAKELTQFAKVILERNRTSLIATAEKNLEERESGAKSLSIPGLEEIFGAKANDPENMAKPKTAPKRKASGEAKAPLSAAQASKVAPRQKPLGQHAH